MLRGTTTMLGPYSSVLSARSRSALRVTRKRDVTIPTDTVIARSSRALRLRCRRTFRKAIVLSRMLAGFGDAGLAGETAAVLRPAATGPLEGG